MTAVVFFFAAAILWIILFFVARNRGERSYPTLFYISLGVTIVAWVSDIYLPHFKSIITLIVCILAIQKLCYIGWIRSVVAAIIYVGILAGLSLYSYKVTH